LPRCSVACRRLMKRSWATTHTRQSGVGWGDKLCARMTEKKLGR
jgi:hypothetical protein